MKHIRFLAALTLGILSGGWAAAQTPAPDATSTPAVATLPADQQATKEQIAKLFEVMRLRQQLATMQKMMPALIAKNIQEQERETLEKMPGGQKLTPEQQQKLAEVSHNMIEKAFDVYPADEMVADISTVYQRHISSSDADALIAFYGSPVGQRLLDAQPVIAQEYLPLVFAHAKERSQALAEEMTKEIQQIVKTPPPAN